MSCLYVDTSILASILCQQKGHELFWNVLLEVKEVVSSNVVEAELFAVARREKIVLEKVTRLLTHIELHFPSGSLQRHYYKIFENAHCAGADAYHIACALDLDSQKNELKFFTADKNQAFVAKKSGLHLMSDPRLKRFLKF